MKRKITKLMAALALLLFVAPPMVGWGQTRTETVTYTLDGSITGGSNGYATESEITQNNITWMVTGNTTMNPWRIGGKNLTGVDRPLYSTSTLSDDITKVVVSNGTANLTVNSMTLIVSANSDFSNPTSTITGTWVASSTTTFERPANTDWSNMYFKLVYNVTAGSSNQYAQFVKAEFYKEGGTSTPSIEADNIEIDYNATDGEIGYTINNPVDDGALTASTEADWLTIGTVGETVPFTCTGNSNGERVATVTLTYTYNTDQTVTKNVTVTQATNPNAPGSEANPYTVAQARAAIDAGTGTQGVYATGIVSAIPTAYSTQYSNITFNMVDEEGDEVFLQAYRCSGDEAADVAVGDIAVVYGNLTKYNTTYEFGSGCTLVSLEHPAVVVEAPIFSPEAGTYDEAQTVAISTATEGADIYYTLDGTEPTMSSAMYETPLQISETTTIKAIAVDGDDNASTVATATYHICSANSPYTVTQALNFIEYPTSTIWVHGIVSTAPTSAPNSNGQLIYYISDNGEATDQLQVYKGKGLNEASFTAQDDIQVGDIVTITGIVKIYNNTKEFDAGNYLVSFERPQSTVPSITVEPDAVSVDANEHDGTLNLAYENLTITDMTDFDIQYYDAQGQELNGDDEPGWIEVSVAEQEPQIGEGYVVSYYMMENEGEARTAYFKVYAMDDETNLVYSNPVTITQEAYVAPATEDWVLTDLADLMEGDIFVIVGTTSDGASFAMSNNNGTSSAPSAIAVTVENSALTGEIADSIKWNLGGNANDGYTFYPDGSTSTWLYCTNTNNGVRVGVNATNNGFVINNDYLYNKATSRYVGIYNSSDWRCYTGINSNIKDQTFTFYKKVVEPETYNLTINGYGQSEGGYSLIASPVYVKPETTGMTEGSFDLYWFDQTQELEWRNYENAAFNLVPGKGYLYAHDTDVELTFTGTPYSGDGTITLVKDDNADWVGWNLVGNPFGNAATISKAYYKLNEYGSEVKAVTETSEVVAVMEGVFVFTEEDGEIITFTEQTTPNNDIVVAQMNINVSKSRGESVDRAIVRFDNGNQLPKFQLNPNHTKVYIPQGNNDYAIVRSDAQGEMPVNFKAQSNGTYTISIDAKNVEMSYLHLIDNMTGADVDLLATPSYTFDANTTDYASRFHLVFSANNVNDNTTSETFAYFNGSEWSISNTGRATLQVVDVLGRIVSSESINGNTTLSTTNLKDGVYMFRLINGENVKVQKVVVK